MSELEWALKPQAMINAVVALRDVWRLTRQEDSGKEDILEMKDQECSVEDHGLFDVIIDPNPFKAATDFSSYFDCLNDDGVVSNFLMIYDILFVIS